MLAYREPPILDQSVILEEPTAARATEFVRRAHTSRSLHHPWMRAPSTTREYTAFVKRNQDPRRAAFLLCTSGDVVGVVIVSEIVRGLFQSAYLSYYAFLPYAGRGLMTTGVGMVLDRAFGMLRLHRLEANIQPANLRSRALATRLGFRMEGLSPEYLKIGGRWRDHERWAILAHEWRTHRPKLMGAAGPRRARLERPAPVAPAR